jgi:hypothetical protein
MGVLGGKSKNTVTQQTCKKVKRDNEAPKQVCEFAEEDEDGNKTKHAVVEAELDENEQPDDVNIDAKGYSDDEIAELKKKTKAQAQDNADGGALGGNTEF